VNTASLVPPEYMRPPVGGLSLDRRNEMGLVDAWSDFREAEKIISEKESKQDREIKSQEQLISKGNTACVCTICKRNIPRGMTYVHSITRPKNSVDFISLYSYNHYRICSRCLGGEDDR